MAQIYKCDICGSVIENEQLPTLGMIIDGIPTPKREEIDACYKCVNELGLYNRTKKTFELRNPLINMLRDRISKLEAERYEVQPEIGYNTGETE